MKKIGKNHKLKPYIIPIDIAELHVVSNQY